MKRGRAPAEKAAGSPEAQVEQIKPLLALARELLVLRDGKSREDLWLWEHTVRVTRLARMLARLPEIGDERPDELVVTVAALFHEAGWAIHHRDGQIGPWQILSRPTSDLQRDLAAVALHERAGTLLAPEALRMAAETIRQCNDRRTALPEAIVLSDATNLDEVGLLSVLRQFRQHQAEGRPLEQLLRTWNRQLEYRYWEARVNECLRLETARRIARERLKGVEQFMATLARDREAADLAKHLKQAGLELPLELPLGEW